MKLTYKGLLILLLGMMMGLQSCGINSNLMFKQAKGESNMDTIPLTPSEVYRISADDKISFSLSTNNGASIIEGISDTDGRATKNSKTSEYLVRRNGKVELPVLGHVEVAGLTVEECEDYLSELFTAEYQDPFVQLKVTNQRVIVFPGNGSGAVVVPLDNTNTTLMEAIALAGGIAVRGKANTVKLMRRIEGERKIYVMDLSTIEGLQYVDMIVQANDYIYVEPTAELGKEVVSNIAPVISLLSSALFIFSAINILK